MGLITGLEICLKLGIKKLIVKGDSLLIIRQMKGLYKVNSDNLKNLHDQAKVLVKNISNIQYIFLRRGLNVEADKLANLIIDLNCDTGVIESNENTIKYN